MNPKATKHFIKTILVDEHLRGEHDGCNEVVIHLDGVNYKCPRCEAKKTLKP